MTEHILQLLSGPAIIHHAVDLRIPQLFLYSFLTDAIVPQQHHRVLNELLPVFALSQPWYEVVPQIQNFQGHNLPLLLYVWNVLRRENKLRNLVLGQNKHFQTAEVFWREQCSESHVGKATILQLKKL